MESVNLDAAERWRREHQKESAGDPPAPRSSGDLSVLVEMLRLEQRRTRTGLALVLGIACPGAGPLFMGAYWFSAIYLLGFSFCAYRALAHVSLLGGQTISLPWLLGALTLWLASFIHAAVLATDDA